MPQETLDTTLIGIMAGLVAALIWVVKALMGRSDRLIATRDAQVSKSLETIASRDKQIEDALRVLGGAVDAFGRFEKAEQETHGALVQQMAAVAETQRQTLELLRELQHDVRDLKQGVEQIVSKQ